MKPKKRGSLAGYVWIVSLVFFVLSLTGCSASIEGTQTDVSQTGILETEEPNHVLALPANQNQIDHLNEIYGNRTAYHGDMHDHADTGPRSDGRTTLPEWKTKLAELEMDFQAILDHRQVKHMYLPEWDDTLFIGGTEAATGSTHYNLIVPEVKVLETILQKYPQYAFTGGKNGVAMEDGTFDYNSIGKDTMYEIIADLKAAGGMFVLAHPMQTGAIKAGPDSYFYGDYTGVEVFYKDSANEESKENYDLWTALLAKGRRVWATAGCDLHNLPDAKALTTVYAEEKTAKSILSHAAAGDFVCGFAGIRMCMGETKMGSSTDFDGKTLILSVGDYYKSVKRDDRTYRIDIISDQGVVASLYTEDSETHYFAFNADENAKFYRVEVHDEKRKNSLIAIGQPIWND